MTERADIVLVIAKEPQPGRVKTRLQSQFSPEEAAELAAAALRDTLTAVRGSAASRRMLAWDGDPQGWGPGFEVTAQPSGSMNARLDAAFAAAFTGARDGAQPRALLIGMDTPQVRSHDLEMDWAGADALLGLCEDGGFWAIGLRAGHPPGVFDGVPMSTSRTGSAQLARLFDLGLSVGLLPPRRDVDRPEDAEAVATTFPDLDFSRCWSRLVAARPVRGCAHLFDQVYAGQATVSSRTVADAVDDQAFLLEVDRWSAAADVVDEMVVSRCEPPVIDLGCGPGRMVRALTRSGRAALGVDISRVAVAASLAQGGPTLQRMVSEPLPAEGRWGTALLMDSNVGIGGNVTALLARCRDLVGAGGLVLCEVDPQRERHEVHDVVLRTSGVSSRPMAWSRVGAATLTRLASALDMVLAEEWVAGGRAFVALRVR